MDIRQITPDFAVAPQIEPADMVALSKAGFKTVINNRPDGEIPGALQSDAMSAAARAAGLDYVENPVVNGALTLDMVRAQGDAVAAAQGAVFAWCRSGTRSAMVWAMSQAGKHPTPDLVALLAKAGYDIPGLGEQIDALIPR